MKRKQYRMQPPVYEIEASEKLYRKMASGGWRLVKRGMFFSRFEPDRPREKVFRLEVRPKSAEQADRQMELYVSMGWTLEEQNGTVRVFSSGEMRRIPECRQSKLKEQRMQTYRILLRKSWLAFAEIFAVVGMALLMYGLYAGSLEKFQSGLLMECVRNFDGMVLAAAALLLDVCAGMQPILRASFALRRLRRGVCGKASASCSAVRIWIYRAACLGTLLLLFCAAAAVSSEESGLLRTADDPYLLAEDLGLQGERIVSPAGNAQSSCLEGTSPWALWWDAAEYFRTDKGRELTLYQEIYRCASQETAKVLLPHIMDSDIFGGPYEKSNGYGMDAVYYGKVSVIAMKGEWIGNLKLLGLSEEETQEALKRLADLWESFSYVPYGIALH